MRSFILTQINENEWVHLALIIFLYFFVLPKVLMCLVLLFYSVFFGFLPIESYPSLIFD